MASKPANKSPDGSSKGNPPERCPRSQYSQDSTDEDFTDPDHDQSGSLEDFNIVIKEEFEDEDEEYGLMKEGSESYEIVTMEEPINSNPPERSPSPPYSHRDSKQETSSITDHQQSDDLSPIKVEIKEEAEQICVMGDQQSTEEDKTKKSEKSSLDSSSGERQVSNLPGLSQPKKPSGRAKLDKDMILSSCLKCGKFFTSETALFVHLKTHISMTYTCLECGRIFPERRELTAHQYNHMRRKSKSKKEKFSTSCVGCGEKFATTSELLEHLKSHTRVTFTCLECGKTFSEKSKLSAHQKSHTGENSNTGEISTSGVGQGESVPEASESQPQENSHTPYICTECGKGFATKEYLNKHQKMHTGERPFSCSQCGKSFIRKENFTVHQRVHTGERPFSCSECEKGFAQKSHLVKHQKIHKGGHSFSCSECGKCFKGKGALTKHKATHTR